MIIILILKSYGVKCLFELEVVILGIIYFFDKVEIGIYNFVVSIFDIME